MSLESIIQSISSSSPYVTLIKDALLIAISGVSLYYLFKFRRELSFPEQISNVPELLDREYRHLEFSSPIKAGPESVKTLRRARNIIRELKKGKKHPEIGPEEREDLFDQYAYRASIALNNIGFQAMVGSIPLRVVLPNLAGIIVEDWNFSLPKVKEIRKKRGLPLKKRQEGEEEIDFARRHAKWLANAAALFLYNNCEEVAVKALVGVLGDKSNVQNRERALRKRELEIANIPKEVAKRIEEFLYNNN